MPLGSAAVRVKRGRPTDLGGRVLGASTESRSAGRDHANMHAIMGTIRKVGVVHCRGLPVDADCHVVVDDLMSGPLLQVPRSQTKSGVPALQVKEPIGEFDIKVRCISERKDNPDLALNGLKYLAVGTTVRSQRAIGMTYARRLS